MWYDVNKTFSHNALMNIVVGPRGFGKTYAAKKKGALNFINKGEQFIYLRRYQAELDLVKDNLFADVSLDDELINHDVSFKNDEYVIDDETAGYAIALTRSNYYKSASFPLVSLIIFDEFIIDKKQRSNYLRAEVEKFLNFYETVARMRENVRVLMLANSLTFYNPYTLYWKIQKPAPGKTISKAVDGLVLFELVGDDEFKDKKKLTKFGKLTAGSDFAAMAIDNVFYQDTDTFIQKKTDTARHLFKFTYNGITLGFWVDYKNSLYFVSYDVDPSCLINYALTLEDHRPNTLLIDRVKDSGLGYLISGYKSGIVRFENQTVKSITEDVLRMLI